MSRRVTDTRQCPCGHVHPNGLGVGWCGCDDCDLLFSPLPRHLLAPEYRDRLEELERLEGDTDVD